MDTIRSSFICEYPDTYIIENAPIGREILCMVKQRIQAALPSFRNMITDFKRNIKYYKQREGVDYALNMNQFYQVLSSQCPKNIRVAFIGKHHLLACLQTLASKVTSREVLNDGHIIDCTKEITAFFY